MLVIKVCHKPTALLFLQQQWLSLILSIHLQTASESLPSWRDDMQPIVETEIMTPPSVQSFLEGIHGVASI